jgi:SAM-dependent methyltransferase
VSAERPCDVCGSRSARPLYEVNGWPIVRCKVCGLVYVGRTVSPEQLLHLYGESYWEDCEEEGYAGYSRAEEAKRRHFGTLLDRLAADRAPGDLLEVGSAYGFFLAEARSRGWRVRGIEPSDHAREQARERFGLDVVETPLTALQPAPESQDAIVMWDVIEHLPDPRRTVEAAFERLRPGGVFALSTGDVGSVAARLHRRDWSLMTPPWHQFYFSRKTMRRLLGSAGFRVERIGGDGLFAVDPESPHPRVPRPLAHLLLTRPMTALARRATAGAIMYAFARKGTA